MSVSDLLYPICDAFIIDLNKRDKRLIGETTHNIDIGLPHPVPFKLQVVDSFVMWESQSLAAAMLHIGGALYCMALSEKKGERIVKLFFLDGDKLGFGDEVAKNGHVRFFPSKWDRSKVYGKMLPGLLCGFWRRPNSIEDWMEMVDPKHKVEKYVEGRDLGLSANEAARFAHDK